MLQHVGASHQNQEFLPSRQKFMFVVYRRNGRVCVCVCVCVCVMAWFGGGLSAQFILEMIEDIAVIGC